MHAGTCWAGGRREPKALSALNDLLLQSCLVPTDDFAAAGVAYHLADIYVEELAGVAEGEPVPPAALSLLLEPFVAAISTTPSQALINRIRCRRGWPHGARLLARSEGGLAGREGRGGSFPG